MRTSSIFFRCLKLLGVAAIIALAIGLYPIGATAQQAPTGEFQLDGGAAQNTSYPACVYGGTCDYWNLLNPTPAAGAHAGTSVFINGEASTQVFIGGGSKDPNPISSWSCTSKSSPDKDTLTNAYAAAYNAPNGDLVATFGADRFSTNGDANIGIWFFQESVVCNPATGKFSGAHTPGDIFLVSAFTVGGTTSTITVYDWNPACLSGVKTPTPSLSGGTPPNSCADTNLELVLTSNAACDSTAGLKSNTSPYSASGTLSTAAACAVSNGNASSGTTVNWPYPLASSSVPSIVPAQALFTGGADITFLSKKQLCFASFLEETRSSQTTSAVLKDFIGGSFNVCSISVSKSCTSSGAPNAAGTGFTDTWSGQVCNTSFGTLTNAQVTDKLPDGTVINPALSSTTLGPKGSANACASYNVSFDTTSLSVTNSAKAKAFFSSTEVDANKCINGDGSITNSPNCSAQATCHNSAASKVTINKHCAAPTLSDLSCSSSGCVVVVPYSAQVCNTGTSQLTGIQVIDYPNPGNNLSPTGGSFPTFTLNAGECTGTTSTTACTSNAQCSGSDTCVGGFCTAPANLSGTYIPTGFDSASTGTSNGRFLFDDSISVTKATSTIGPGISPVSGCTNSTDLACSGQTCPLCPSGECGIVVPN